MRSAGEDILELQRVSDFDPAMVVLVNDYHD